MRINLDTRYRVGQYVRHYYTKIENGNITQQLGGKILKIIAIHVDVDVMFDEVFYMYLLEDGLLYREKDIIGYN